MDKNKNPRRFIYALLTVALLFGITGLITARLPWHYMLNGFVVGANIFGLLYNYMLQRAYQKHKILCDLLAERQQKVWYHQTRANDFCKELIIQERELQAYKDVFGELPKK